MQPRAGMVLGLRILCTGKNIFKEWRVLRAVFVALQETVEHTEKP